ncbi:hypothetical protein PCANC_23189 [Puccinia coronata f. sp. avenae]|uniref:Uncharacterized protein n=1 Tax=Puccinia coronata f. sp. avenae TaxID=200324 RepID=A0A2N5SAT6_9BASI|nr:hypothetical protein PCANC_23189 [Puccinia coronata f. sp. avenae]
MKTSQHDGQEHFRQSNQGRANEALGRLNQNSSTTLTDAVNLAGNVVERKKWRSNRKSSDDDADGQEGGGSQSGRPRTSVGTRIYVVFASVQAVNPSGGAGSERIHRGVRRGRAGTYSRKNSSLRASTNPTCSHAIPRSPSVEAGQNRIWQAHPQEKPPTDDALGPEPTPSFSPQLPILLKLLRNQWKPLKLKKLERKPRKKSNPVAPVRKRSEFAMIVFFVMDRLMNQKNQR